MLKPEKETWKNSVVFSPMLEDEVEEYSDQHSVEDGGTKSKPENTKYVRKGFSSVYPSSSRNSVYSRFSDISFRSNITAHHYSFLMSFLMMLFLAFVLGAVTVKFFICSSGEKLEDLMENMNNTNINQINPSFL